MPRSSSASNACLSSTSVENRLSTRTDARALPVAGVYADYGTPRGQVSLAADALAQSNYVAIVFEMEDFRQPNETDTRLLG